jgi:hypothetical protein
MSQRTSKWLEKWKPAVDKTWLYLLAGMVWSGVGLLLLRYVYLWLAQEEIRFMLVLLFLGIALASTIFRFGFSGLAKKNIHRIRNMQGGKLCIFAFQEWKSYPLVVVMISMGVYLRKYSPIPKPYLAVLYAGIGGALLLASTHYYGMLGGIKRAGRVSKGGSGMG